MLCGRSVSSLSPEFVNCFVNKEIITCFVLLFTVKMQNSELIMACSYLFVSSSILG